MPDLHIRLTEDDHDDDAVRTVISALSETEALEMLRTAEIVAEKLVPWGSNYTFAVGLSTGEDAEYIGIYKPRLGERPLWDFPNGTLYLREYAAYLLSRWLGWDLVPPTVLREGPHGPGSLQLYVEPTEEPVDEAAFWGRKVPEIEQMVMFDFLSNNADRKIGHCLVDPKGRIWGIDHGLTFNVDPKLRTVLWQFSGDAISEPVMDDVRRMLDDKAVIFDELSAVLAEDEVLALKSRVWQLVNSGRYPVLDPHYNVPYGWW
jgi:hypothetical protein